MTSTTSLNDQNLNVINCFIQQSRRSRYQEVRSMLDGIIQLREKEDERYQSFFEKEIHLLHGSLISESKVKESYHLL